MIAQKPHHFYLILGSPTSKGYFLLPRSCQNQQDSSSIQHWHPNTNSMSIDVFMWPQWCYFNGCHIWHRWHELSFVHFDGFWCASHRFSFSMDNYKPKNGWRFAQMVKTLKSKNVVMHAQLEIILFHYWWCPQDSKPL